jgi:glycosyltransferase involved in cell wall biosynthesis
VTPLSESPPMAGEFLSVVMPVHNALPHLHASVASILGQTHADFEFVIRDDGSTDGSLEALRGWALRDQRIRLTEGGHRLGPVDSSNEVVRQARGTVVARMDADDVAHPDRLRRQLDVLLADPRVAMVGSLWRSIDEGGRWNGRSDRWRLTRRSAFAPFPHTSIMFRRDVFEQLGGYRSDCTYWEDADFFVRVANEGRVAVVPEALVGVRLHGTSTRLGRKDAVEDAYDRMHRCFADLRRRGHYDPAEHQFRDRLTPEAIVALGALELWAGGRPRTLARLLRRGRLAPGGGTAAALAWGTCAAASPAGLRLALRTLHRARDRSVGARVRHDVVYEWKPGVLPRPLPAPA